MVVDRRAASLLACGLLAGCFQDPLPAATSQTAASETGMTSTTEGPPTTSSSGGSTAHESVCGDGVVDFDEECDDGNVALDDGCLPGCKLPACGDGVVSPGEACDDGNSLDDDTCTHLCTAPVCGDGIVSPGEICDDGDDEPLDACDSCAPTRCGDGVVQSRIEECDDGNLDPHDACSATCRLNLCGNLVQDPEEEGIDCGGACGACCTNNDQCAPGTLCLGTACRIPSTCKEWQDHVPGLISGATMVDPDGSGAIPPLVVYCEVVPDECAYTLLRIDDPALGKTQPAYVAACAELGWEIVVTRTPAHAERLFIWNDGAAANLLNVFPNYPKAMGLNNWSAVCRNQPCPFWMTADVNGDVGCMVSFEPSGDSKPGDRIERRLDGCGFEGNWNDFGQNVEIQGWVICSPNDC